MPVPERQNLFWHKVFSSKINLVFFRVNRRFTSCINEIKENILLLKSWKWIILLECNFTILGLNLIKMFYFHVFLVTDFCSNLNIKCMWQDIHTIYKTKKWINPWKKILNFTVYCFSGDPIIVSGLNEHTFAYFSYLL